MVALNIAIVTFPAIGHFIPVVETAQILSNAGHNVTIFSSQTLLKYFNANYPNPNFDFFGLDDGLIPENEFSHLGKPNHIKMHPILYARDQMAKPLENALMQSPKKFDFMLCDYLSFAGPLVANTFRIRHAILLSWPLVMMEKMNLISASVTDEFFSLISNIFARLPYFIPKPGPPHELFRELKKVCRDHLVIVTSCFGIESPRYLPPLIQMVGRCGLPSLSFVPPSQLNMETFEEMNYDLPINHPVQCGEIKNPKIKNFLNNNNNIIYVSFGSRLNPSPDQIRDLADGLSRGNWKVIWSMKASHHQYLPKSVTEENFLIESWVPQKEILTYPNIKLVITHCGLGGLHECITNAKPIVCVPLGADQPFNAKIAVDNGFGVLLFPKMITSDRVLSTVLRIMDNYETFLKAAKRVRYFQYAQSHDDKIVRVIENAAIFGTDYLIKSKKPVSNIFKLFCAFFFGVGSALAVQFLQNYY